MSLSDRERVEGFHLSGSVTVGIGVDLTRSERVEGFRLP